MTLYFRILILFCLFYFSSAVSIWSQDATNDAVNNGAPTFQNPVKITADIQINKIYGINTVDETYIVDGYFIARWLNDNPSVLVSKANELLIFENNLADEKIGSEIWVPAFEFINVVGNRNIANKQLIIEPGGLITYNERFNAVFTTTMDFKRFPFDEQCFVIQMEAFSYDNRQLIFSNSSSELDFDDSKMSEGWIVTDKKAYVNTMDYTHLSENGERSVFSRYNQEINASRKVRYYLWQFILPLFLIITISWSVFWLSNLSDQLATSFTLMLTVVAFNFNTSTILPSLPYSTFIESLITLGYLSIFVSLIVILFANARDKSHHHFNKERLMHRCKLIFPGAFVLLTLFQTVIFFF